MDLILGNGEYLKPIRILGEPQIIANKERDVLTFEFDPEQYDVDYLSALFIQPTNCQYLYTQAGPNDRRKQIGEGYCIYIGTDLIERTKIHEPGVMCEPEVENIIITKLAQLTWDEYQDFKNGTWVHPWVR